MPFTLQIMVLGLNTLRVYKEKSGYDPLAFMIEEAHKRNIEFHAWINPYRITMNHTDINRLSNNHPARQHRIGLYLMAENYITTRYSRSKKFITEGALEIVQNYDVDALHMDDYFIHIKWRVNNSPIKNVRII